MSVGGFVFHIYVPDILLCSVDNETQEENRQDKDIDEDFFDKGGAEEYD